MNYPEIDQLYDARLLHVLKKGIASKDEPGRRYDVFKIDYGCYVDLITTTRAPLGLLLGDENDQFWTFPRTTIGRYAEPYSGRMNSTWHLADSPLHTRVTVRLEYAPP